MSFRRGSETSSFYYTKLKFLIPTRSSSIHPNDYNETNWILNFEDCKNLRETQFESFNISKREFSIIFFGLLWTDHHHHPSFRKRLPFKKLKDHLRKLILKWWSKTKIKEKEQLVENIDFSCFLRKKNNKLAINISNQKWKRMNLSYFLFYFSVWRQF